MPTQILCTYAHHLSVGWNLSGALKQMAVFLFPASSAKCSVFLPPCTAALYSQHPLTKDHQTRGSGVPSIHRPRLTASAGVTVKDELKFLCSSVFFKGHTWNRKMV